MARMTDKGIVGLVGNLVFYTVNGKTYVRARPAKRKKKKGEPAKPLNTVFGTVSRYGTSMMNGVKPELAFPMGRDAYNKVRGWMRNLYAERHESAQWILSTRTSGACPINPEADFRDFFREEITVKDCGKGKILIGIPAINPQLTLRLPIRTMKVNLKLMAVSSPFRGTTGPRYSLCKELLSFTLTKKQIPARELVLQTSTSARDITLVVAALEFYTEETGEDEILKDPKWLPASIIAMGRMKK